MRFIKLTLLISCLSFFSCSESLKSNDTQIEERITDFYEWYSYEIKQGNTSAFQPTFVSDSNGMSTLDFTQMSANLAVVGFHADYLLDFRKDFELCLSNLKKIPFDSLENLDGLSFFEDIDCAFFNAYQWTKDMEIHDGVEVEKITKNDDSTAIAECRIFNVAENMRMYWEHKYLMINLRKTNSEWRISNIEIVFP